MRILIIGFIAFACWSVFSTYIYVCKIKGLCMKPQTTLVETAKPQGTLEPTSKVEEKTSIPKDLVVYFAFDKSDLISDALASIYFDKSNAYLNKNQHAIINITGHTDAVGTIEYNQALGLRRAQTMHQYFANKGISESRITIESKGKEEPVADNKSDQGRAKNRRSVVTIKY